MALLKPCLSIVEEKEVSGAVILAVKRDLQESVDCKLKERIDTLAEEGRPYVLIDLEHAPEMDSSDLGRLIRSHLALRKAGGRVCLFNVSERVGTLLQMTRLDTVFDVYGSQADALAAVGQDPSAGP